MSETTTPTAKPTRHKVLFWALAAVLLCYIDRIIISLAAIEMKTDLGWDDTAKGTILSAFFVGYLVMQILGGLLANRFGGRNVFLWAVIVWSLFTVLTPAASNISFSMLIFARFMVGFGEGAAFPAVYSLINQWMRKDEVTTSVGYMTAATAIGTVLALLLSGIIIEKYGWPSVFYLFGSLGFVWAIFWIFIVPKRARISEDRLQDTKTEKSPIPWRILLTHPAALAVYIIAMSGAIISFTLVTWMPSYFADTFGSTVSQAGIYSLFPFITITFIAVFAGKFGDRLIKNGASSLKVRKRMTYLGFIVCAIFLALMTQSESVWFSVMCLSVAFGSFGIAAPAYSAIPGEMLPNHGDILYGFMAAAGSVVSTFTIGFTGVILDKTGSYDLTFLIISAGSFIGVILFGILADNKPIYR